MPKRKEKKDFAVAPARVQQVVCCDVIDVGMKDYGWGPKHRCWIRFFSEFTDKTGKPISIQEEYTLSLYGSSHLKRDLESWRGRNFTDEEIEEFAAEPMEWLERLIGVNAIVTIKHNEKNGKTYANIGMIGPCPPEQEKLTIPEDYVRRRDWTDPKKEEKPEPTPDRGRGAVEQTFGDEDIDWADDDLDDLPF